MSLAVFNGLLMSIALETAILRDQIAVKVALKTALGMSMISMKVSMNFNYVLLTGGAKLTLWIMSIMLIIEFVPPLPYNYWRLKKWSIDCCG